MDEQNNNQRELAAAHDTAKALRNYVEEESPKQLGEQTMENHDNLMKLCGEVRNPDAKAIIVRASLEMIKKGNEGLNTENAKLLLNKEEGKAAEGIVRLSTDMPFGVGKNVLESSKISSTIVEDENGMQGIELDINQYDGDTNSKIYFSMQEINQFGQEYIIENGPRYGQENGLMFVAKTEDKSAFITFHLDPISKKPVLESIVIDGRYPDIRENEINPLLIELEDRAKADIIEANTHLS